MCGEAILFGKSEKERPVGRSRRTGKDNIKMDFKAIRRVSIK